MKAAFAFAILLCAFGSGASADPIVEQDFQSGKIDQWKAAGDGDVRLTSFAGNVSLRLQGNGSAMTAFATTGFRGVGIGVSLAAQNLGANDSCIAEISTDQGQTWTVVHQIGRGMDDAITMHPGGGAVSAIDDRPAIALRLRAQTANAGATCWADNVHVRGWPIVHLPATWSSGTRTVLTRAELLDASAKPRAVATDAFTPPPSARAPRNTFRGRLVFTAERAGIAFHVLRDDFGDAKFGNGDAQHLPKFDFAFVQSGDAIIPVQRGALAGANKENEFILEPGRVWDEPGDGDYSRAAIPFTLEERNANCMHNGLLTFLFKNDGAVSDVAFQIASETCFYFKFDMWGRMAAKYVPGAVEKADATIAAYNQEIANRLPTKPISALAERYPGAHPDQFGSPAEIDPAMMTAYGVIVDGVNYVAGCETRFGAYPFCDVVDLPSYSTAKSVFGGIGLMRLAQLYPGVTKETVATWVPACARTGTWNDVTLQNVTDMATGDYKLTGDQQDENNGPDIAPFFAGETHAAKIDYACAHYPRQRTPGTFMVYHTTDTYVLGTAMAAYVHAKMGKDVDIYRDVIAEPIWRRLKLSPPMFVTRRTYDDVGQPFVGYGLTYHRDDIAKIAVFLNNDHGTIASQPVLDQSMILAALQRDPNNWGMKGPTDDFRYHNGIWAWNAQRWIGCKSPAWVPFMSGYGGIVVAMFPNGMNYYYFSDGGVWAWAMAAAEANRIKPFCEA